MSTYKKLLFIINPNAGMRRKESPLSQIIMTFSDYDYETIVCFTKKQGDGTRLVEEHASSDIDLIVCMGGDGTLNETFAGARKIGWDKCVGYIPAGSTNDFAATLGLSSDPVKAAENIMTGTPHNLDLGELNGRLFVYTACCGIFTKTSYETPQKIKNRLGHFAYVLEGMKDLGDLHPVHMKIETKNQKIEDNFIFVAICNTFSIGGIMTLDENDVTLDDGEFELLTVSMPRDIMQLNNIVSYLYEQKYSDEGFDSSIMSYTKVSEAKITIPIPNDDWSLDGERGVVKESNTFKVLASAVKFLY